jgi:hypothetical protein
MALAFWEQVVANEFKVPRDRPLADLTSELTGMLGDPDPKVRDGLAYPTLAAWISEGVYDDLLHGLGDGMTAGLDVGLGSDGSDTVFRRSASARILCQCIARDNAKQLLGPDALMTWGDRAASWWVRERDLRGFVPGRGWAHAIANGADVIGALALSSSMGRLELTVLLDVVADRVLKPSGYLWCHGEDDRVAAATMNALRRDILGLDVLEPWLARVASKAMPTGPTNSDVFLVSGNVQAYLRALYLQLALAPQPPVNRADLLLAIIDHLKRTNPRYLR